MNAALQASGLPWPSPRPRPWLGAGLAYRPGSFGVTAAGKVPRNERLTRLRAGSREAAEHWPVYVHAWMRWNHRRTIASRVAARCAAGTLYGTGAGA